MWIATAEHSREIDRKATDEFGVPARVLMERAGLAVFDAIREMLPGGGSIAILCGKGNNGGDGFVVARLARDNGYRVECLVAADDAEQLKPEALEQMHIAVAQNVRPIFATDARFARKLEALSSYELLVDALLGTGARCEVKGSVKDVIQAINRSGVPAIAVDVPSGIDANTGEELGESVWALRTVTFGLPKRFLFEGTGLEHSGYWTVAHIGIPRDLLHQPTAAKLVEGEWVANLLPERLKASHKGDCGSLLIVAGSDHMRGAAVLVAKAALRAGIGLVTVASVRSVIDAVAAQLPEALLLPLPDEDGLLGAEAAKKLIPHLSKSNAAVFGPGLTHEPCVIHFLGQIWQDWHKPCVIDADALNAVSEGVPLPDADCVLTPHPGEMGRLLRCSVAEIQSDRFRTVAHGVSAFNQCVLLKGPYSIVGEAGQPMMVNSTGNPGLATGGMGDTLCGIIGTLLAQDLPGYYAATCGMYWHGHAGDDCARRIGTIGYTAQEVADALPLSRNAIVGVCCDGPSTP